MAGDQVAAKTAPLKHVGYMENKKYSVEIDTATATEWSELLTTFEDANLYQTWSYGAVRWGEHNLSHLVLRQAGSVVGMAQLRIISVPLLRRGIAYLRWGPVCQLRGTELNGQILSGMAMALRREYVEKRRLFLRLLPSVFEETQQAELFRNAFRRYHSAPVRNGKPEKTIILDLDPPLEELRRKLDQKWRNQLNRAEKNGLEIVEGDGADLFASFLTIYREMWTRKKFQEGVDVEEFARIQQSLPPALRMRVRLCLDHGTAVAGIVCSAMGHTGIYLLGATSDSGLKSKGAYLLQWSMIQWLKQNGYQNYDLGGIDPEGNPGVYHFKSGFSGREVERVSPLECGESLSSAMAMKAADFIQGGVLSKFRVAAQSALARRAPAANGGTT